MTLDNFKRKIYIWAIHHRNRTRSLSRTVMLDRMHFPIKSINENWMHLVLAVLDSNVTGVLLLFKRDSLIIIHPATLGSKLADLLITFAVHVGQP